MAAMALASHAAQLGLTGQMALVFGSGIGISQNVDRALEVLGLHVLRVRDDQQILDDLPSGLIRLVVVVAESACQKAVDLCRRARRSYQVPILVALGASASQKDIASALDAGADSYIVAPFQQDLLTALCRAAYRRAEHCPAPSETLTVRDLKVDQGRCEVIVQGRPVNLSPIEFRLLRCLAGNAGNVVSSARLFREATGYEGDPQEVQTAIKVYIRRLRTKLQPAEGTPDFITNVRGFGYMVERRAKSRSGERSNKGPYGPQAMP